MITPPPRTNKIAFVDLETTGLNPSKAEILEIGAVVYDITAGTMQEYSAKVKPLFIERADPKALEINGYNEKDWKDAGTLEEALAGLGEIAEGATFFAYNVSFDWSFLEVAYSATELPIPFHYHRLCVMSMATIKIPKSKVQSYSLKTVCAYLGIAPEPKIHRALNGAQKAFEVYMKLTKV